MAKINYIVERSATGWNDVCGRLPWQWKTMGSLEGKKKRERCLHNKRSERKNMRMLDEKEQEQEDRRRRGRGNRWGEFETGNGGSGWQKYRRQPTWKAKKSKKKKKVSSQQTVDFQFIRELLAKIRRSRIKHYKMFSGATRSSSAGRMLWWQTPEQRDYLLYCGITAWNKHEESSLGASLNPPL